MGRKAVRNFAARHQGTAFAAVGRSLAKALFDPYRPELHYMRGPGPKWHAKHDPAPAAIDGDTMLAPVRIKA
jgi:hypothetical protein